MARRPRSLKPVDQINLTSLLDLTFVLLIAFMIVAPTLRPEIDVNLPQDVKHTKGGQPDDRTIVISIGKKSEGGSLDRIYLTAKNKKTERVQDIDELVDFLKSARLRDPKTNVVIEVDRLAPSETLIRVFGACQAAGIEALNIPTGDAELKDIE